MRDSVEFLRSKSTEYAGEYNPEPSRIFKAAGKEIARLRRRLAEARLTDAEREVVENAAAFIHDKGLHRQSPSMVADAATLRGLLERTRCS
jgi:hypothetical protein